MSKTIAQLIAEAEEIRLETETNANTAERVGSTIEDVVEYVDGLEEEVGEQAADITELQETVAVHADDIAGLELSLYGELTGYAEVNGAITDTGTVGSLTQYGHSVLPVKQGETYMLENYSESNDNMRYVFATTDTCDTGETIPRVGAVNSVPHATKRIVTIPAGCTHLWWNSKGYLSKIYVLNSKKLDSLIDATKKTCYTSGATYTDNSIMFGENAALWWKNNEQGIALHIEPSATYTFTSSNNAALVLRGSGNNPSDYTLLQCANAEIQPSDVVLLYWSISAGKFMSGALYAEYVNYRLGMMEQGLVESMLQPVEGYEVTPYSVTTDGRLGMDGDYPRGVIPVEPGQIMRIYDGNRNSGDIRYVFATEDYRTPGGTIPRVGEVGIVPLGETRTFTIPEGCTHLLYGTHTYRIEVFRYNENGANLIAVTKKMCYTTGDVVYGSNSLTFLSGSKLYYKGMESAQNSNHIDFNADTTFAFDSVSASTLVLRDGQLLLVVSSEVLASDVVLLFWSVGRKDFVSGLLYPEYIGKNVSNAVNNIPFEHGGYSGVSTTYVINYTTSQNRLRVELPVDNIASIKTKGNYKIAALLLGGDVPTSVYKSVVSTASANVTIDVQKECAECEFTPKKILVAIANSNVNTYFPDTVESVDDMIEIKYLSMPAHVIEKPRRTVKRFQLLKGYISTTDSQLGLNTKSADYIQNRLHTPRLIRMLDDIVIKEEIAYKGNVFLYDRSYNCFGYYSLNTIRTEGEGIIHKEWAYYIRLAFSPNEAELPTDGVLLEGVWDGHEEVFLPRPADDGFFCLCFPVKVNLCKQPDAVVSEICDQYTDSEDHALIHLPESYTPDGKPTPLIIYLHGAAERYNQSSTRFGENVRYSPEWAAMGYAQLDVDMIPELYNLTIANTSGTADDEVCVEAAYQWAIEHYNIRRDGVYLFGRSRGGMAVHRILARYNPLKLPVICALSNAGANCVSIYGLFRSKTKEAWWNSFCVSMGLSELNPPSTVATKIIPEQPEVVQFLLDHIGIWWDKAKVILPMMTENPTEYHTPSEIFTALMESYETDPIGQTFLTNFVKECTFKSPVPLRFDWCVGDQIAIAGNYGTAGKDAFIQSSENLYGNCIYRKWPSCPAGNEPHYHEKFNLVDEYTLPNGVTVEDASMAQIEWMLWAMSIDKRQL